MPTFGQDVRARLETSGKTYLRNTHGLNVQAIGRTNQLALPLLRVILEWRPYKETLLTR
jgi:hypothetical protein